MVDDSVFEWFFYFMELNVSGPVTNQIFGKFTVESFSRNTALTVDITWTLLILVLNIIWTEDHFLLLIMKQTYYDA